MHFLLFSFFVSVCIPEVTREGQGLPNHDYVKRISFSIHELLTHVIFSPGSGIEMLHMLIIPSKFTRHLIVSHIKT